MKTKTNFLIYALSMAGLYVMLVGGCTPTSTDDTTSNTVTKPKIDITMVNIPAGTFMMGSPASEVSRDPNNENQFQVTLSAFKMSKFEITNAQYAAFLNAEKIGSDALYAAGAYPKQALVYPSTPPYDWGLHYSGAQWVPAAGCENFPVTFVNWYGATVFAAYVGGRLPTEAEWEYACRAGSTGPFSTGNCLGSLEANYGWSQPYSSCVRTNNPSPGKPLVVGSYAANAWGLCDMYGNQWEWCSDIYGLYPTTPQTNPTGAKTGSGRVSRGGGYHAPASFCRSASRAGCDANPITGLDTGMRIVMN
jgi:formylglycine-generating enzyme required for sulfatase activity